MRNFLHAFLLCMWVSSVASYGQDTPALIITGIIDGPLSGGVPKALEIYALQNVNDLSSYSVANFNNGNTSRTATTQLSGSIAAGEFFYVATETTGFTSFFGFAPDVTGSALSVNGDDAVALYQGTTLVDVFGSIGTDGTGLDWEYTDGWAYRENGSEPNGGTFVADQWIYSGTNALDNETSNATASTPFPMGFFTSSGGTDMPSVFVNELRISSPGSTDDNSNYVEIAGDAGTSLDGLSLVVLSGEFAPGQVDFVFDLSGITIDEDGFVLIRNEALDQAISHAVEEDNDLVADFDFFGSPTTFLLVSNFTGNQGSDLDTDNDGTLDTTPWDAVLDGVSLEDGDDNPDYAYSNTVVAPDGSFTAAGAARRPDESGEFQSLAFDSFAQDTPGATNGEVVEPDQLTLIHTIQGSGEASPLQGQTVTIEGIVVGDFQENDGDEFNSDLDGFYVQEEAADFDENDSTSEGIFVYAPGAADVNPGDIVRLSGTVTEFNGLTELTNVNLISISETGALPEPISFELPATDEALEAVEGMYVNFTQPLVISEYFNFDRFGEVVLSLPMEDLDRLYQPTSYINPENIDSLENTLEEIDLRTITLDDARTVQNPDPARHPNGQEFTLDNRFRGGDIVQNVTGILSYAFGRYRIQPTTGADYQPVNPRTAQPAAVGGRLQVAAFNVLNYFTTFGSRGADNQTEFERQRNKIIAALSTINADIVGLIEIENNTEAIENLVSGLNEAMGAGTYDYIETGVIGTDEIKVAFIYQPATVEPVGDFAILTSDQDPRFVDTRNRPPLAQTFREKSSDEVFTVVVNHLKSKGSGCGAGDDDPFQGNCNLTRTQAAEAIVDWLATDPTGSDDPDYMIIGDLNAYDKEDPIDAFLEGADDELGTEDDYVDLLKAFEGEFAYSYLFGGQLGYLDYALVNRSLYEQITGTTAWHINSDEPDILDYDITFKQDAQDSLYAPNPYRSSDHDPVIVGVKLEPKKITLGDCEFELSDFPEAADIVAVQAITFAESYFYRGSYVTGIATGIRQDGRAGIWEIHNDCTVKPVGRTGFRDFFTTILPEVRGLERDLGWRYEPFAISDDGQYIYANAVNEAGYQHPRFSIAAGTVVSVKYRVFRPVLGRIINLRGETDCHPEAIRYRGRYVVLGCSDNDGSRLAESSREENQLTEETTFTPVTVRAYPNPVAEELHVVLESPIAEAAHLAFYDLSGRLLYQTEVSLLAGTNLVTLNARTWGAQQGELLLKITLPTQGVFPVKLLKK